MTEKSNRNYQLDVLKLFAINMPDKTKKQKTLIQPSRPSHVTVIPVVFSPINFSVCDTNTTIARKSFKTSSW